MQCFAVSAPGVAPLLGAELRKLGVAGEVSAAGVEWSGGSSSLYTANLWSRTATRVVVRIARFSAKTFFELERRARRIEWQRWFAAGSRVRFRITCRKSRLYHSGAVAQRLGEAAARVAGVEWEVDSHPEDDAQPGGALVIGRFERDELLLSIDSSGEPLHRRGYRLATAKAPIRENLASAMLMAAQWRVDRPIIDPFCGSGTILIEAALMARNIAPGTGRRFGFEDWPDHDTALWSRIRDDAAAGERRSAPGAIIGSDRDPGAIEAASANAERARVGGDLALDVRPISALDAPVSEPGWLVTNPPYGHRVGDARRVADLYAALGKVARERLPGWHLALLSPDPVLDSHVGLAWREEFRTRNGGIPVRLLVTTL